MSHYDHNNLHNIFEYDKIYFTYHTLSSLNTSLIKFKNKIMVKRRFG